jgi:Fe-S cluster biosynthesis and repair protein YggX
MYCSYLKREAEALSKAPYPGPLGQRVLESISKDAWQLWLAKQTMLINEQRLSPLDPKVRKYLAEQMEAFLFGDGGDKVAGFVPTGD